MMVRRIGLGTISLLLIVVGILWDVSFGGFGGVCLGDIVLGYLGLKAWSNGIDGALTHHTHLTVYYSLIFFISAFIIAIKNKNDFGARVGKIVSLIIGAVLALSVFGLAV